MQVSNLDDALWAAGTLGEVLLLGVLIARRSYRTFPIFTGWIAYVILSEPIMYWILHHASERVYYQAFFASNLPEYLLQAGVLIEVAANVLKPVNKAMPKGILYFLIAFMAAIAAVGFLVAANMNSASLAHPRSFLVINATMAILRLVTFILIAAFSQVLGIGWKNHVLQLVSGLAFYAAVDLIVEIAHSHQRGGPDYPRRYFELEHFRVLSYLCALYFWSYSFLRKEAPRKEFNSKMSELLVSIAGTAKQQQFIVAGKRE